MPKSHTVSAARSVPMWIIAGVAVLAGGVGSAAVLSASQFLSEARTSEIQLKSVAKAPVAVATVIARPDRQMPKGFVAEAPAAPVRPTQLSENDPRFGVAAAAGATDAFAMVDKSAVVDSAADDEPVTLAALGEKPEKPTKTMKKAEDDKPKAVKAKAGKVTGRSVTNDDVNIRAGASSKSAVIGVVPANTSVDIVKCASWCEIAYEGKRGYVYSGFLGRGGAKAKSAAAPALAEAKPTDGKVRSSVTLQPKKKWSLFGKSETDSAPEAPTPAFN